MITTNSQTEKKPHYMQYVFLSAAIAFLSLLTLSQYYASFQNINLILCILALLIGYLLYDVRNGSFFYEKKNVIYYCLIGIGTALLLFYSGAKNEFIDVLHDPNMEVLLGLIMSFALLLSIGAPMQNKVYRGTLLINILGTFAIALTTQSSFLSMLLLPFSFVILVIILYYIFVKGKIDDKDKVRLGVLQVLSLLTLVTLCLVSFYKGNIDIQTGFGISAFKQFFLFLLFGFSIRLYSYVINSFFLFGLRPVPGTKYKKNDLTPKQQREKKVYEEMLEGFKSMVPENSIVDMKYILLTLVLFAVLMFINRKTQFFSVYEVVYVITVVYPLLIRIFYRAKSL